MKYAALLALFAPLSVAVAGGPVTGPEVMTLLEEVGHSAELDQDGVGDPLILTGVGELGYRIYFYDCEDGACEALQFRLGLDLADGATADMVNDFNRDYRYGRSFLDAESDPFLLMDVEMTHADHASQLRTHLGIWEGLVDSFTRAMDFHRNGGSWEEERIAWPMAPLPGGSLLYDSSHASVNASDAGRVEIRSSGLTRIWLEDGDADADGYLQRWMSSQTSVDVEGAPAELEEVLSNAIRAFDGIVLEVELDDEGHYTAIANLEQIQPLYRETMRGMFTNLGAALMEGNVVDEVSAGMAGMESMLDALTAPQVLEGQLAELLVAYNFPAGGGLQLDREYAYQDEGASPFGGETIPMNNTMLLRASQQVPGHYELVWTIVPDPEATWSVIGAAARHLIGGVVDGHEGADELIDRELEALGRDASFSTTVTYRIDPFTGVVQHMEHVATKRFGGKEEVETSVLALRVAGP
ncbi:YbjN domain-containing protein [Luteimonas sp. A277]